MDQTDGSDRRANKVVIHFPGGGLFYWWQHGALMSLRSMVDLTDEVSVVRLGEMCSLEICGTP